MSIVVASAAEAEYAAIFMNDQVVEVHRTVLWVSSIFSDNTMAFGISHKTVKLKRAKAMDMHFHLGQGRVAQKHFIISFWDCANNLADFFTKAHTSGSSTSGDNACLSTCIAPILKQISSQVIIHSM